jgi:hypothetical protein
MTNEKKPGTFDGEDVVFHSFAADLASGLPFKPHKGKHAKLWMAAELRAGLKEWLKGQQLEPMPKETLRRVRRVLKRFYGWDDNEVSDRTLERQIVEPGIGSCGRKADLSLSSTISDR